MDTNKEWFTTTEVGTIFAVQPSTVRRWIVAGKIDRSACVKRGVLHIPRSEVLKIIQERYGSER